MVSGESQPRGGRERGPGGRGFRRPAPKVCMYCVDQIRRIDYKDLEHLRGMITEHGKIKTRRMTGNCAFHQRRMAEAVKRARQMALLPFVVR